MAEFTEIDRQIFAGSDTPFNSKDEVYAWLSEQIEDFDYFDRAYLPALEAKVAMLWHLSSYFCNVVTTRRRVLRWRASALVFFDRETEERGDAAEVLGWRLNIERNFDRLIQALPEDQ